MENKFYQNPETEVSITRSFNYNQIESTQLNITSRINQISITSNTNQNRILVAAESSGILYLSINSDLTSTCLQQVNSTQFLARGIEYNPENSNFFTLSVAYNGLYLYEISNDQIEQGEVEKLSISEDFAGLAHFAQGTFVLAISNSTNMMYLVQVNVEEGSLTLALNYSNNASKNCYTATIFNDLYAYLSCNGGVYEYNISTYKITFNQIVYQDTKQFYRFAFLPSQAYYSLLSDALNGNLIPLEQLYPSSYDSIINLESQQISDLVFLEQSTVIIVASMSSNTSNLTVLQYCPLACNQCNSDATCTSCLVQHYDSGSGNCALWCDRVCTVCQGSASACYTDSFVLPTSNTSGNGWFYQASFEPQSDLLLLANNQELGSLFIFNTSANTFLLTYTWSPTGLTFPAGVQFLNSNSSLALIVCSNSSIKIIIVANSPCSVSLLYSLTETNDVQSIALSPSQTRCIAGTYSAGRLQYYELETSPATITLTESFNISTEGLENCRYSTFLSETELLVSCYTTGLHIFSVGTVALSYLLQAITLTTPMGVTMLADSTSEGIVALAQPLTINTFTYSWQTNSVSISGVYQSAEEFPSYTVFNTKLTRMVVIGENFSIIYPGGSTPYCQQTNSNGICEICYGAQNSAQSRLLPNCSCPSSYLDVAPVSYDCQRCVSNGCATCVNTATCSTCKYSWPPRYGSLCACAEGYFDDGLSAECRGNS